MNIRWIVIFAEVAADGSFSRAAMRLNVAQPWLSAQIHKLEAETGVTLFDRLNTGLKLTPEGSDLLPYAQQIATAYHQFRDRARTMGDVRSKSVRMGSYLPMMETEALHRLNGNFAVHHPQYSLGIETGPMDWLLERLQAGQFDMVAGISPLPDNQEQRYEVLEVGPVTPFLLVPRDKASAFTKGDVEGEVIAAPPIASHPSLLNSLLDPWQQAGASVRSAPEPDRRALEHLARAHGSAVLMIDGKPEAYADDQTVAAMLLPNIDAAHVLIRIADRGLGRAAERYWTMSAALPGAQARIMEPQP